MIFKTKKNQNKFQLKLAKNIDPCIKDSINQTNAHYFSKNRESDFQTKGTLIVFLLSLKDKNSSKKTFFAF